MIRTLLTITLTCFACAALPKDDPLAAPQASDDLKSIFNGKDLTGWDGDPRLWSVKDGAIRGETTPKNKSDGNTFLIWTDGRTKDFELRLSFRCNATNNSGIQYRSKPITEGGTRNQWVVRGYQHEIRNQDMLPNVAGFIYDEGGLASRDCLSHEAEPWQRANKERNQLLRDMRNLLADLGCQSCCREREFAGADGF